jgi:nucleoid DNA-binding protein
VLNTLATYLYQHKQVVIPHVGSFKLRYQPAVLNFSDRIIYSPYYQIEYSYEEEVDISQIEYLSVATTLERNEVQEQLKALGQALKHKLAQSSFEWKGVGHFEQNDSSIQFRSFNTNLLAPVPAHKVIHEHAQHNVRVGEDHIQSGEAAERLRQQEPKKSMLMMWIWILIGLATAFIVFHLYNKGFKVSSSGSQYRVSYLQKAASRLT